MSARLRGMRPLLALALLGLLGCAVLRPVPGPSDDDRRAYREALAAASQDPRQGVAQLGAFLRERPESPLADAAAVELAELLLEAGDENAALQRLLWTLRRAPNGASSDRARLLLAGIERGRGQTEAAWKTASRIRVGRLEPGPRLAAERLLADLADERGDPVEALLWLSRVRADVGDPAAVERVDLEIEALLGRMDGEQLARAAEQLGDRTPAARAQMRRAELAMASGYVDVAAEALAEAADLPLSPEEAERLTRLEARLRSRERGSDRVARLPAPGALAPLPQPQPGRLQGTLGVALPLSGPFARFGEESLQGILLATGMFDAGDAVQRGGLRLLVRDTQGTAQAAAAAVASLAAERDLLAILGPLGREESEAAAVAAERAQVPLLTLGRREEVAYDRPEVFRLALTPRLEAELLASFASTRLGARRFAILHPKDEYGWQLRGFFWDAVERQGGEVVGVAGYDVDATDFAGPIRSLVGFTLLTPGQRSALAERGRLLDRAKRSGRENAEQLRAQAAALTGPGGAPLPPFVDFDVLFIPDAYDNVALIAPQLAFHDVRGVRLLGASGWNHPDLVSIARRHVNGAVFTAVAYPDSRLAHVADFNRRFQATFGQPADSFAAEAFDAATLLLHQLAGRRESREEVRRGLLASGVVPGVSGVMAVGPDGNVDKRPYLLGIERGEIVSLD